jgi:hypothetical protein
MEFSQTRRLMPSSMSCPAISEVLHGRGLGSYVLLPARDGGRLRANDEERTQALDTDQANATSRRLLDVLAAVALEGARRRESGPFSGAAAAALGIGTG